VYGRLLEKLDRAREALGGQVFDVLGRLTFEDKPLRELLLEAIRYGDLPETRAKLNQVVDTALDHESLRELLEERALARDSMDNHKVRKIREDMERAEARRLQPHFVASFFREARKHWEAPFTRGTEAVRGETRPSIVVRAIDRRDAGPLLPRYERITFEKELVSIQESPLRTCVPGILP
jgi:hypothetical protein